MRQVVYPTKNALRSWCRDCEQRSYSPKGYACSKPKYSQEHKDVAVRHYLGHGSCIAFTIRSLGHPGRDSPRS